jgi:hypothetical protein
MFSAYLFSRLLSALGNGAAAAGLRFHSDAPLEDCKTDDLDAKEEQDNSHELLSKLSFIKNIRCQPRYVQKQPQLSHNKRGSTYFCSLLAVE